MRVSCPSIPDLFHASNDLVKLFGLNLNRKKARIQKKLAKEIAKLIVLVDCFEETIQGHKYANYYR